MMWPRSESEKPVFKWFSVFISSVRCVSHVRKEIFGPRSTAVCECSEKKREKETAVSSLWCDSLLIILSMLSWGLRVCAFVCVWWLVRVRLELSGVGEKVRVSTLGHCFLTTQHYHPKITRTHTQAQRLTQFSQSKATPLSLSFTETGL